MDEVTTAQVDRVTQAEFARMCGVSRKTITTWKVSGWVVMDGSQVNVAESLRKLKMYRDKHDGRAVRGDRARGPSQVAPGVALEVPRRTVPCTRGELIERLKVLDWSTPFKPDLMETRLQTAVECVGFVLATASERDDGHWGGYQLRSRSLLERHSQVCFDVIVAGHGFELDAFDVLQACRNHIWHESDAAVDCGDLMTDVSEELLGALAYPFNEVHGQADKRATA